MATSIVCHSCGNRIEVAEDHARRKVRCPECGVMCDVKDAAKSAPRPPRKRTGEADPSPPASLPAADPDLSEVEELARQLWGEPDPPAKAPPERARRPDKEKAEETAAVPASEQPSPVWEEPRRRASPPPGPPKRAAQMWTEEDEDGSPYDVSGGLPQPCPDCSHDMEPGAVLCVRCGYDVRAGKKRAREFPPLTRTWEPGLSRDGRWGLFLAMAVGSLVLSVATAVFGGPWYVPIGPWIGFVAMTSFLMGTFPRVDLARDKRGNVRLTQTWHVCFVQRPTRDIDLRDYQGVVTGRSRDAGCFAWLIFFILLGYFIIPGIVWWYHVIHKRGTIYYTALSHSHGYPEVKLYTGPSQEEAEEMAKVLRDAARLHWDRG